MQKNGILVLTILLLIQPLRGEENKIVQLLHVNKDKVHSKLDQNYSLDMLYYIKNNSIFYRTIDNDNGDINQSEESIKLYEKSKKGDKYHEVQGRVVLIGQPVIKETYIPRYKTGSTEKRWIMPAVIKKPGILGTILRPDIYTIEYTKIDTSMIDVNPKTLLNVENEHQLLDPEEDEYKFVITKQYEGHRTPVTKVGIFKDYDGFAIYSGSKWPTVKYKTLDKNVESAILKNHYLIDVNKKLSILVPAKKNFFGQFKWSLIFNQNASTNVNTIDASSLPNIVFNEGISTTAEKLYNLLNQYNNSSNQNDNVLHKSNSNEYCLYILFMNDTMYQYYVVTLEKEQRLMNLFYKNESGHYKSTICGTEVAEENELITAHTFDFTHQNLFYAIYNKKTKTSPIKKLDRNNTEEEVYSDDKDNDSENEWS